ncbi:MULTISPECIES: type III secretion system translocon subunit SctE [Proteus]|uniref:Cell division protein n=1 Tax=Proteus columbae TaxID=1987580 RepID=A0A6I7DGJ8_9GAMM|nr:MULTISPECIES: type III secretion system translocon subunit SctE [Proteus]MBG2802460.1 type III secretion system translocon subunit SctE [Proteus mirabilis]MBG3019097.1 type III secretion system translocon subunit SctE [Proteus mirabilis]MBG3151077.1 type III secretion system translocon subunit SctE [Proteus mirabilis]QHN12018.1 cell division protein [Proteus columbae]
MNDIKKVNDNMVFSTPLPSKEVENVVKKTTQQAQRINAVNESIVSSQIKDKENKNFAPALRAPIEQKKNNQRINIQDDVQYKINIFSQQNTKANNRNISQEQQSSPTPSVIICSTNNKSSKEYDFVYLQLSYQNVIHQNILDQIKDPDKLDYYIDKLNALSKGVDGLREKFKSAINEFKNNKDAYIDYWMEVYNQIKSNDFKTESEIRNFLKNNNIPRSLIKELLSGKIKSKSDMEKSLEKIFPFLKLPDDLSNLSLDDLDKLYNSLSQFFDNIFKVMPNVSISEDRINTITSHQDELRALINKKENASIKEKLEQIKEVYRALTTTQSALELEIMSNSLSGMALLTFLLAKTRELTLKVMLQRSENEQKLFEEMQKVTEKSLKEKIDDQKNQIKKQEEIQFWAGIGLKLLAGLVAIVAGIASIFTAGASMALMAVAVVLMVADAALTVADEVYQAIHGTSFMDELMQPLTEALMEALDKVVDFLADVIYNAIDELKKLGIDKKIIEDIKNSIQDKLKMGLKGLITAVLFISAIALSFVVGPAMNGITNVAKQIINQQVRDMLKRVFNEALELMMGKMIKEIIVQVFEEAIKKINALFAKEISQKAGVMLNRTVVISKLINATATNAVNIYSSVLSAKIMQSVADSKKLDTILNLIQKLMDKIMESYHENIDTITGILKNMSEKSSISNRTKSDMIRNISI